MDTRKYQEEAQIELILAVSIGNVDGAIRALTAGAYVDAPLPKADIEIRAPYQLTDADRHASALHIAVTYGHADIVKLLLNNRNDPNQVCNDETPLTIAAKTGNIDIASILLDHGADVNLTNSLDESPFLISEMKCDTKLSVMLLSRGADPNARESYCITQIKKLHTYTNMQDDESINKICDYLAEYSSSRLLFDALVDKNYFQTCILNAMSGPTCLALLRLVDFLAENGKHDLKKLLPAKYTFANKNLKEDIFAGIKKLPLAERLKKYDAILHHESSPYYQIFHMKRGYFTGVSENRGVLHDIREAYNDDRKAYDDSQKAHDTKKNLNNNLYQAIVTNDIPAMRAYIEQGADVNFQYTTKGIPYPIQLASFFGFSTEAVRILLENGADINVATDDGNLSSGTSALSYAASAGKAEVVDLLLSKGANTEISRNSDNGTALMLAIDIANLKIVTSLLNHDAKIDTFGNAKVDFKSPLALAVRAGSEEILNTLVNHMIDHYDIQRIVTFLQTHDTLKTCFTRAGTNSKLLAPLQKLAKYLVIHHVGSEILDSILPERIATPEKKVDTIPETTTASLYPKLDQEITPQSDALQQYLDAAKQRQFVSLPPVLLNPITGEPLPIVKSAEAASDPLAAIDAILMAPKAPKHASWLAELNEIDFSQTEPSSTAVIMNQLGDLMRFEEPAIPYVNPFDELVEQDKQAVAAKSGYKNPFDEMTEDQHDAHVAAQLDALPKPPTGGTFFAVQKVSQSNTNVSDKKIIAALN